MLFIDRSGRIVGGEIAQSEGLAIRPDRQASQTFRFPPNAVAVHVTVYDTANSAGVISQGAAVRVRR